MKAWDGSIPADCFIGYQPFLYHGNPPPARGSRRFNCHKCGDHIWFDRITQQRIAQRPEAKLTCFACMEWNGADDVAFCHRDEDLTQEYGADKAHRLAQNREDIDDNFVPHMIRYAKLLKALRQKPVNPCLNHTPPKTSPQ